MKKSSFNLRSFAVPLLLAALLFPSAASAAATHPSLGLGGLVLKMFAASPVSAAVRIGSDYQVASAVTAMGQTEGFVPPALTFFPQPALPSSGADIQIPSVAVPAIQQSQSIQAINDRLSKSVANLSQQIALIAKSVAANAVPSSMPVSYGQASWQPVVYSLSNAIANNTYFKGDSVGTFTGVINNSLVNASQLFVSGTSSFGGPVSSLGNISIAPAAKLALVGSVSTSKSYPIGLFIEGKYAYVGNFAGGTSGSFDIIDISTPSHPVIISSVTAGMTAASKVYVAGNYAYMTTFYPNSLLHVFDISDKTHPKELSSLGVAYCARQVNAQGPYVIEDNQCDGLENYLIANPNNLLYNSHNVPATSNAADIAVLGKYAYTVSQAGSGKFKIVDVSNPQNMVIVGSTDLPMGTPYSIAVQDRYAYVTASGGKLYTIDVSNPFAPLVVGSASTAGDAGNGQLETNISVSGKYAAVTAAGALQIFDISNPAAPVLTSSVAMPDPRDVMISGRYVYAVDSTDNKLEIFDMGGIDAPAASISSLEAGNLVVRNDLTVSGQIHADAGLNVGIGGLLSNGPIVSYVASSTAYNSIAALFNGGNVGIGISTPFATLSVKGSGSTTPFTVASSSGSTLFQISPNGNVGIGTTTPGTPLSVVGTASIGDGLGNMSIFSSQSGCGTSNSVNMVNLGCNSARNIGRAGVSIGSGNQALSSTNSTSNLIFEIGEGNYSDTSSAYGINTLMGTENIAYSGNNAAFGLANLVGEYDASGAFGYENTAVGLRANAIGASNTAGVAGNGGTATSSTTVQPQAFGYGNTARSNNASAFGVSNTASSSGSIAFGISNVVTGANSSAFGTSITNSVDGSTMIGPSNAAKLTILSTGSVGIGTTTPPYALTVVGDIDATANVRANGVVLTSDRRYKEDIAPSNLGLDFINKLNPVSYQLISDASGKTHYGFIAQDVESTLGLSTATLAQFGGLDYDASADRYGLSYNDFIAPSVRAIQELSAKLDALASTTGSVSASRGSGLMANVISGLQSLGATISQGAAAFTSVIADQLSAKIIVVNNATIDNLTVNNGITIKGKDGNMYCIFVDVGGIMKNTLGACGTAQAASPAADLNLASASSSEASSTPDSSLDASSSPPLVSDSGMSSTDGASSVPEN